MATRCSTGAPSDREQLIRQCLPDVQVRAWEIAHLNQQVEIEDLIAVGNLALVRAANRWDPTGGASFRAYAYICTRGAMLDYLRRNGAMGRHDIHRSFAIERARFRFAAREGRFPSDAEVARELGWTVRQMSVHQQRALRAVPHSLEDPVVGPPSGEVSHLEDLIPAGVDVEREVCADETAAEVAAHVRTLPVNEQLIIRWTFWEDRKLREMGESLGLSESRVSQIRKAALKHLRHVAPDLQEAA